MPHCHFPPGLMAMINRQESCTACLHMISLHMIISLPYVSASHRHPACALQWLQRLLAFLGLSSRRQRFSSGGRLGTAAATTRGRGRASASPSTSTSTGQLFNSAAATSAAGASRDHLGAQQGSGHRAPPPAAGTSPEHQPSHAGGAAARVAPGPQADVPAAQTAGSSSRGHVLGTGSSSSREEVQQAASLSELRARRMERFGGR